jgi:fumarate hydratase, class II
VRDAYYGAQTARAVENFPISNLRFPRRFIRALGLIKKARRPDQSGAGRRQTRNGRRHRQGRAGSHRRQMGREFVLDIFQTGSGTSTNMNANEVIANRAIELLGGKRGDKWSIPTTTSIAANPATTSFPPPFIWPRLDGIERSSFRRLNELHGAGKAKAGRNSRRPQNRPHPFAGRHAHPARPGIQRLRQPGRARHRTPARGEKNLGELALGGTAVGTGINTHIDFARRTIARIAAETGLNCARPATISKPRADATPSSKPAARSRPSPSASSRSPTTSASSAPARAAALGELKLPATQPGSSIMPGKVNPVMCEMLMQVGAQVLGNDAAITFGGSFGNFELNVMMPVMAHNFCKPSNCWPKAAAFSPAAASPAWKPTARNARATSKTASPTAPSLAPVIGYDKAAKIAKVAYETNRTIRQVALEISGLDKASRRNNACFFRIRARWWSGWGGSFSGSCRRDQAFI